MVGLRPEFLTISLALGILGAVLKYKTDKKKVPRGLIPLILFGVSFLICATWGYQLSDFQGGRRWVETLLIYGIVHGLVTAGISSWFWSAFHGAYKVMLEKFFSISKENTEVGK